LLFKLAWLILPQRDYKLSRELVKKKPGQGYHPPDPDAKGPIQLGLKCLQGWGIHRFSGQPAAAFQDL